MKDSPRRPSPKKWTSQKPTAPGYYWVRSPSNPTPRILLFERYQGEGTDGMEPTNGPHSTQGWQDFAGPIPHPTG